MPPQKGFLGQENYLDRNVCNDFLELVPQSTIEIVQDKKLTPLNPRLWIVEGLFDKSNWVRMLIPHK